MSLKDTSGINQYFLFMSQQAMVAELEAMERVVRDTPEPITSPFPFMKLPPELRIMIYKYHFFQPFDHRANAQCWDKQECEPGGAGCPVACINNGEPLHNVFMTCKTVYHEAMPLYFSKRDFHFEKLEHLGRFLANIGPYHRQHLTSIIFDYEKIGTTPIFHIHEAFRLLGDCPNLRKLVIKIASHHIARKATLPALATLAKIRGLEKVDVRWFDAYWVSYIYGEDLPAAKKLVCDKLRPLRVPHTPAALQRREAMGITKRTKLRVTFGRGKPESRAERCERRNQVKEIA
ncbi:MAG: hypothetical protein LQ345_002770 [Seirophora villosa]|nr:MAG: hypothetical protein LQ345_002770 [Seirophora villosa]